MKHKDFYLYQLSETLLNTTIKTIGILFAWLMLTTFNLSQSLVLFIGASWFCQIIALLLFSWIYQQSDIKINNKKIFNIILCYLLAIFFINFI